ncbi:MAG TPA: phage major capsid protein [Cyclobacteriaceae bacterium]|nr:phage major capsid protein [Cyclobacteriaceae bacterium]
MKDELKEKREERADKEKSLNLLLDKAAKEQLSADEKKQFDDLETETAELDIEIKRLESIEARSKKRAERDIEAGRGALPGAVQDNAAEEKELLAIASKFSLSAAMKEIAVGKKSHVTGVAAEVYQIAQKEAKEAETEITGMIAIPQKFIQIGKRKALTVGTEGADVVFTEYGGKVIPFLNPEPIAEKLGVTFLQGLQGNVQWPRETGELAFSFETETGDVDEMTPTYDNVSISPKRFGGYIDVTLQMLRQSPAISEGYVRRKIDTRLEITIDEQIFNGSGAGNQTTGLFNMGGVNVLSLGSGSANDMTYRALLSMKRDAKAANARKGKPGWATNAYGEYALLMTPLQTNGVEGNFILKPDYNGRLFAEPFLTSQIIPSNFSEGGQTDLCGLAYSTNWGGLFTGFWGGVDLTIDNITQKLGGKVRWIVNAFMDVDVEQPLEFSICKDWDATDLPATT